jgi:hypothetical protein
MMIRSAVIADCNRAVELLHGSHLAAGFDRPDGPSGFVVPFDPAYAMRLFLAHVASLRMLCLTLVVARQPQGILMATASEHPFGPVWLARETAWWIDPNHRGSAASRMLDAYEHWAKCEQRCAFAGMAGMGEDPDVAKLYLRRGYRVAETHFLKVL